MLLIRYRRRDYLDRRRTRGRLPVAVSRSAPFYRDFVGQSSHPAIGLVGYPSSPKTAGEAIRKRSNGNEAQPSNQP